MSPAVRANYSRKTVSQSSMLDLIGKKHRANLKAESHSSMKKE